MSDIAIEEKILNALKKAGGEITKRELYYELRESVSALEILSNLDALESVGRVFIDGQTIILED